MERGRLSSFFRWAADRDQRLYYAIVVLLVLALPMALQQNTYYLRIGVLVLLYFVLALGYNAIVTTAGLFDLGYTAYFAVGAYASALLLLHTSLSFWLILAGSILITLIYTALASVPILRFKGDYLCIITLALAEIVRLVANNWLTVTRGPLGLPGIRDPQLFGITFNSLVHYYYLAAAVAAIAFILINRLTYSAVGLRWSSIKENPETAESVGINIHRAKMSVYLVGAALAGSVGAVSAPFQGIVDPSVATLDNTVLILTMVILGGGSNAGLLASSMLLTVVPELLRSLSTYRLLVLGVFFVFVMNARPAGFRFGVLRHFVLPEWGKQGKRGTTARPMAVAQEALAAAPLPGRADQATVRGAAAPPPVPAGQVILRGAGVSKYFGGLYAVDGVDFELHQGEILGIIGPNGAGKTTLFNMIAGTYPPTAGKVYLDDISITGWKPYQIARHGVARTFQILKILPNLTVLDNIVLACLPETKGDNGNRNGHTVEEYVSQARIASSWLGLEGQEATIAKSLPFGGRRRLELARALAMHPRIVLMDEPASGMNPNEVEELMQLIRKIRESGISILLIEHNMTVAMDLSDRIIVLNHGVKIAEGTPREIQSNEQVIEAYLGGEDQGARS